jgi:hypothetical protein
MIRPSRFAAIGLCCTALSALGSAQSAWITFTDETSLRLPTDAGFTGDPDEKDFTVIDIDHDGDLDIIDIQKNAIYANVGARSHRLLINTNGTFTDQAATLAPGFLANQSIGRLAAIKDFDGDGWEDVIVINTNDAGCTTGNQLQMHRNLGVNGSGQWLGLQYDTAGRFPQYTSPCARFCGGDAGDVDNDGDMDLYVGDYNNTLEDKLLINDGTGVFTDQTASRIPGGTASTFTVDIYIRDINNDGWNDILISDGTVGLVKLRINNGAGSFPTLVQPPNAATYTLAAGELNNDGWLDLYQGRDGQDAYNLNTSTVPGQSPTFTTTVLSASPGTQGFAGNAQIVDMDNDGRNDIVMGDIDVDVPDCTRHATLLRNVASASLPILSDPYSATGGCVFPNGGCQNFHTNGTHDIAVIDLNGDGRKDMVYGLCTGYRCFIQNAPPFSLLVTEPAPGAMTLAVDGAPVNSPVFNLTTLTQLVAPGSGPFFGLDASALVFFTSFYPMEPFLGFTNGNGQYSYAFPAGTFPQSITWTWQMRSVAIVGNTTLLSNIETRTF